MRDYLSRFERIHFVGVGGVSMSKLCAYTLSCGKVCTGSDAKDSDVIAKLRELGVEIHIGNGESLARRADLVVYTSAMPKDCRDIKVAKTSIERKNYLARVSERFESVIAISGSHGKTTVTSMLSWVMKCAKLPFTAHIGGDIVGIDNLNMNYGHKCFITEACEYARSFLELSPDIGVVLNVDYDHPDCYANIADTYLAFSIFALRSKTLIFDNRYNIQSFMNGFDNIHGEQTKYVSFGNNDKSRYKLGEVNSNYGVIDFDVYRDGKLLDNFTVHSYNEINALCGLSVIAIADTYGIGIDDIKQGLATFPGVKNRFQCLGLISTGARVITDYAHHPCEIQTVIKAGRQISNDRVITVFEPHTFSRTKALISGFVSALSASDVVILMPTFKAREVSGEIDECLNLYKLLTEVMDNVVYCAGYDEVREYLSKNTTPNDVVLTVGAGLDASKFMTV